MPASDRVPWIVLCETERTRWGGDVRRRAHTFRELALATGASLWAVIGRLLADEMLARTGLGGRLESRPGIPS